MRIIYIFVLSLLLLSACGKDTPPPSTAIRPASIFVIGTTDSAQSHLYSGEVRARHETVLGFRLGGKMVARNVEAGERVRPGQVLARLDPADSRLQESAAAAQYRLAEEELKRYRDLRAFVQHGRRILSPSGGMAAP